MSAAELPALPAPLFPLGYRGGLPRSEMFTAQQMREYALAALADANDTIANLVRALRDATEAPTFEPESGASPTLVELARLRAWALAQFGADVQYGGDHPLATSAVAIAKATGAASCGDVDSRGRPLVTFCEGGTP